MQLCAFDQNNELIFIHHALKQQDYICIECREKVRVRSGLHRQPHYYHIKPNHACRLHAKGLIHLLLQYSIQQLYPSDEVHLEYRFPSIGRIADVALVSKKLIFEIQCSPISAEEVEARNEAYASLGYQVIWILHDSRFNQNRLTAAEHALQSFPHYFTNMNSFGEGNIYDQFAFIQKGLRQQRLPKLNVDLTSPKHWLQENWVNKEKKRLKPLLERAKAWSISFAGDYTDNCLKLLKNENALPEFLQAIANLKEENLDDELCWTYLKGLCQRYLIAPYLAVLRIILERNTR